MKLQNVALKNGESIDGGSIYVSGQYMPEKNLDLGEILHRSPDMSPLAGAGSKVTLVGSEVSESVAKGMGGAFYVDLGAALEITSGSKILGCKATHGGAGAATGAGTTVVASGVSKPSPSSGMASPMETI